ncbi:MAG: DEAD/DEAH box helicase, partial [Acidobacteria bacterium]|nr:DEAD/DEAH box helicase [Acidobacteriota bacterium]
TTNRSVAVLIQAGFNSRLAAIKAVTDTGADFSTLAELQVWLASHLVHALEQLPDWPTAETKEIWGSFTAGFVPREGRTWSERRYWAWVQWRPGAVIPPVGAPLRVAIIDGARLVTAPDGEVIGELRAPLNPARRGLVRAEALAEANKIEITYFGPDDLWAE